MIPFIFKLNLKTEDFFLLKYLLPDIILNDFGNNVFLEQDYSFIFKGRSNTFIQDLNNGFKLKSINDWQNFIKLLYAIDFPYTKEETIISYLKRFSISSFFNYYSKQAASDSYDFFVDIFKLPLRDRILKVRFLSTKEKENFYSFILKMLNIVKFSDFNNLFHPFFIRKVFEITSNFDWRTFKSYVYDIEDLETSLLSLLLLFPL